MKNVLAGLVFLVVVAPVQSKAATIDKIVATQWCEIFGYKVLHFKPDGTYEGLDGGRKLWGDWSKRKSLEPTVGLVFGNREYVAHIDKRGLRLTLFVVGHSDNSILMKPC